MDFSEFIRQFSPTGDLNIVYAPPAFYEQLAADLGERIDSQLAEAAWFEPNRGESAPPGYKDLMSMSEEEIDAYWDEQERQLETMEGLNNEEITTSSIDASRLRGLSPDFFIIDDLWPNNNGLTQSNDDVDPADREY